MTRMPIPPLGRHVIVIIVIIDWIDDCNLLQKIHDGKDEQDDHNAEQCKGILRHDDDDDCVQCLWTQGFAPQEYDHDDEYGDDGHKTLYLSLHDDLEPW